MTADAVTAVQAVTIGGISIYRLRAGRLAEAWVQYDQAGLVRQLQARQP